MHSGKSLIVGGIVAAQVFAAAAPAGAAGPTSTYTKLNLDQCNQLSVGEDNASAEWVCPGLGNRPVWVREGDLRFFVSFGGTGKDQVATGETLGPFNRIGETLEWRLGANGQPFATILRWFAEFDDGRVGQVLVVTKLAADGVCHVAYVDALANKNANELARQAADNLSAGFRCGTQQPVIMGTPGWLTGR